MFMNKKLRSTWNWAVTKFHFWRARREEMSDIEKIAKAMGEDEYDGFSTPSREENPAQYGVHPKTLTEFGIRLGGHTVQTSIFRKSDGTAIKYPSKIKRNDGSIETFEVITNEEAHKRAEAEETAREEAMGFPPRCPECKVVLPEGTVLGPDPTHQKPYEDKCEPIVIGLNSKPCLSADDRSDDPLVKIIKEKKTSKSRRKK